MIPLLLSALSYAGGGPASVVVLYNADEPDALDVAQHYQEARHLPPGHLCGVTGVDPEARTMDFAQVNLLVREPLQSCIAALPQPEEIDYLVLVRGLPYRVDLEGGGSTSLSALLQVGRATSSAGVELAGTSNSDTTGTDNPWYMGGYAFTGDYTVENPYSDWYASAPGVVRVSEQPRSFARERGGSDGGYDYTGELFIVTRLDGFDYLDAHDLIDRSVASDGSFPTAELLCMHAADSARGARDPECEFTTRMLSAAGFNGVWLDPFDGALEGHEVAAYFTGTTSLQGAIDGQTYVPGAITCNLTSFGAVPNNFFCSEDGQTCPESESQTSIARFVRAGATGAHGTVAEPYNSVFPNASALLFYTFGYNLGESYLFSQRYLYWMNLVLGDPLATPYAQRPEVILDEGEVPLGQAVVLTATHPDGVARVRLYADGLLVAEERGDFLTWTPEGEANDELELLGVAVAENAPVTRAGWPNPDQEPRPDVQGWTTTWIALAEPVDTGDTGLVDTGDTAEGAPGEGCEGCASSGAGAAWLVALPLLGLLRRRR